MSVDIDPGRRSRTAGEQAVKPRADVASWEIASNADSQLAKLAEAQDVWVMLVDDLGDVSGDLLLFDVPSL